MRPVLWPSVGFTTPKERIVDFINSRACGCSHNKTIHAEQFAIEYCRKNDKRNKYEIYISRYARDGCIKPAYCCHACAQLAKKYKFENRIFSH